MPPGVRFVRKAALLRPRIPESCRDGAVAQFSRLLQPVVSRTREDAIDADAGSERAEHMSVRRCYPCHAISEALNTTDRRSKENSLQ